MADILATTLLGDCVSFYLAMHESDRPIHDPAIDRVKASLRRR